jgi:ribosomal 50S subunit-recycling heat shock protein
MLNDKVARASAEVKIGDVITISFGNRETKVEVLSLQETVRKEEAADLFRYL